jgi:hypothetical protein
MQYDQHKFGDFLAVASGLPLASSQSAQPAATVILSTGTVSGKYADTIEPAGTGQILTPGPASYRTSYLAAPEERRGLRVSDADKRYRLDLTWLQKNGQVRLPPVKNEKPIPKAVVKVIGTLK